MGLAQDPVISPYMHQAKGSCGNPLQPLKARYSAQINQITGRWTMMETGDKDELGLTWRLVFHARNGGSDDASGRGRPG